MPDTAGGKGAAHDPSVIAGATAYPRSDATIAAQAAAERADELARLHRKLDKEEAAVASIKAELARLEAGD